MAETKSMTTFPRVPLVLRGAVPRTWLRPVSRYPALRRMRRESGFRGRGERVNVTLKTWKLLVQTGGRDSATAVVPAIAVLHAS